MARLTKTERDIRNFTIANRKVGDGHPAFIIAEIGNNHNGSFDLALQLIDLAVECGADAAKFQTKNIETAFSAELLDQPYLGINSFGKTYREHKQALELSSDEYLELKRYCDCKGIIFLSTPFDLESVAVLLEIGVPAWKIASFHVTNLTLLEAVSKTKLPIILSCGMSTLPEIDEAVEVFRHHDVDFSILQCTSSYPTNDRDVNLSVIPELRRRYKCVVGYSGHERGISIAAASICFSAKIIEKHFTLDRTMKGPDHAASLEPKGLAALVERTRLLESAVGTSEKSVLDSELGTRMKNRGY